MGLPDVGKEVVLWAHGDANLYHCMVTGRACSALLLWANHQTLIDWGASLQTTVKVATYGSKFAAGRRATEQNKCCYLGVPIAGPSHNFGDNESVIINGEITWVAILLGSLFPQSFA
jgi:hypothetical protein